MGKFLELITKTLKDNAVTVKGLTKKLDGTVLRVKIVNEPPFIKVLNIEENKR